jgi:hypothetical protein
MGTMERIIANGDIMVESAETGSPEPIGFEMAPLRRGFFVIPCSLPITELVALAITETVFKLLFAICRLRPQASLWCSSPKVHETRHWPCRHRGWPLVAGSILAIGDGPLRPFSLEASADRRII